MPGTDAETTARTAERIRLAARDAALAELAAMVLAITLVSPTLDAETTETPLPTAREMLTTEAELAVRLTNRARTFAMAAELTEDAAMTATRDLVLAMAATEADDAESAA
jgi:hypothetical protein